MLVLLRSQGHLYVHCSQKFPCCLTCTLRTKKKVNKKCKLKKRITYRPSRQRRQNLIKILPAHKNTESQNLRIKCASTQCYRNSKWLCGSCPQEWTSNGRFLVSSLSIHSHWLKIFFLFLKRKIS